METIAIVSAAVTLIAFFWAVRSTQHAIKVESENVRLLRRTKDLELAGAMAMDVLKALEKTKPATPQFDAQTTSLIKLAVGNSNENEARSAAMQACKRLHKQIR